MDAKTDAVTGAGIKQRDRNARRARVDKFLRRRRRLADR